MHRALSEQTLVRPLAFPRASDSPDEIFYCLPAAITTPAQPKPYQLQVRKSRRLHWGTAACKDAENADGKTRRLAAARKF